MNTHEVALQAQTTNAVSIYSDTTSFENAQRICKMLASSTLVPKEYQNNLPNTMIAYEMSVRTGMSVFMVMQNLDIIQGRPSWNSKYVIAALNSCGRFAPLQFEYQDLGDKTVEYNATVWNEKQKSKQATSIKIHNRSCMAVSRNINGDVIRGPLVTIEMAVKEGWYTKSDSKWPTMPEVMLTYRAAKFFGNIYAPDVLMGMYSSDEVTDIGHPPLNPAQPSPTNFSGPIQVLNDKIVNQNQNTHDAHVIEEEPLSDNDEELV